MTELGSIQRKAAEAQRREERPLEFLASPRPCAFAFINPTRRDYLLPRLLSGRVRVGERIGKGPYDRETNARLADIKRENPGSAV